MQIDDAVRRFETQLRADGRSPNTISSYLRDLRTLAGWLAGSRRPSDVRRLSTDGLSAFVTSHEAALKPDGTPRAPGSVDRVKDVPQGVLLVPGDGRGPLDEPTSASREHEPLSRPAVAGRRPPDPTFSPHACGRRLPAGLISKLPVLFRTLRESQNDGGDDSEELLEELKRKVREA